MSEKIEQLKNKLRLVSSYQKSVAKFSHAMFEELVENAHKGHWQFLTEKEINKELAHHLQKFFLAETDQERQHYAVDIANIAMMAFENSGGGMKAPPIESDE